MVCAPSSVRVSPTAEIFPLALHDAPPIAPPRLQLLALKLPPPGGTLLALQLTVPLGALAGEGVLSGTGADLGGGRLIRNESGAQLTTVLVACLFAVTTKLPALLRCVVSPL